MKFGKELAIAILLILLFFATAQINPNFLQGSNLQNIARLIGIYGVLSLGISFVIITGGIDLSIGSVVCLLGVLLVKASMARLPVPVVVAIVIGGGALLGLLHGVLVTRFRLQPFVVTLCGLLFYRSVARYIAEDSTLGVTSANHADWAKVISEQNLLGLPLPFIVLLILAVPTWVLLHRSVYGTHLLATGQNREAARFAGVKTQSTTVWAYIICGLFCGVGAIMVAGYTGSVQASQHGANLELYAIAAAVLGGCSLRGGEGSILGTLLGIALLRLIVNFTNLVKIPSSLESAVMAAVIFLGAIIDSALLSKRRQ